MKIQNILSRISAFLFYICSTVGAAVFLFLFFEFLAGFIPRPVENLQSTYPLTSRQPWGKAFLRDWNEYRWKTQYSPYVTFVPQPFESEMINVNKDHTRRTVNNSEVENALKISFFGGSTAQGIGSPDWGTVPSYISKAINQSSKGYHPIRVTNFGCLWWASSQELIQLILTLRKESRPDVVLFYDGINDISVVTYGGAAGKIGPPFESFLSRVYSSKLTSYGSPIRDLWNHSDLARVLMRSDEIRSLVNRNLYTNSSPAPKAKELSQEMERGAALAAEIYLNNLRTVRALGREYGFEPYFYLQPFPLLSKKKLTKIESDNFEQKRGGRNHKVIESFYNKIRNSAEFKNQSDSFDISDVFDGSEKEFFLDSEHVLPIGNELVAKRIVEITPGLKRERRLISERSRGALE